MPYKLPQVIAGLKIPQLDSTAYTASDSKRTVRTECDRGDRITSLDAVDQPLLLLIINIYIAVHPTSDHMVVVDGHRTDTSLVQQFVVTLVFVLESVVADLFVLSQSSTPDSG